MAEEKPSPPKSEPAAPTPPATSPPTDLKLGSNKDLALGAKRRAQAAANAMRQFFTKKESIWAELPDMFSSLFSYDRPTRRMALLFFLSLSGLSLVIGTVFFRYWEVKKATILAETQRRTRKMEQLIRQEAEEAKRRGSLITLGNFTVELIEVAKERLGVGEVNMAEIEIVLLCDGHETRDYIEENTSQVRNQLTNILTAMDREELMSREGKKKLKTVMVRKLNDWLPHGKVEDVYFSKLVLN